MTDDRAEVEILRRLLDAKNLELARVQRKLEQMSEEKVVTGAIGPISVEKIVARIAGVQKPDQTPAEKLTEVYAKMHRDRMALVEESRRARDYHARLAGIVALVEEHAERYSRGSPTRMALDNLAVEIQARAL